MAFSRALIILFLLAAVPPAMPQARSIRVIGEVVCLPVRDASGPQTLECAIGLRDDQRRYFALRESEPAIRSIAGIATGSRVEVRGMFTEREDPKYQSAGVIEVSGVSPAAQPSGTAFGFSLPAGEGAWVLTVLTSGGFAGQGRGNVSITSQADLTCNSRGALCPDKLADATFQPFAAMIPPVASLKWPDLTPGGLCSDCFTTTATFHYRERGGAVQRRTGTWNTATESGVPPALTRVVEAALALGK